MIYHRFLLIRIDCKFRTIKLADPQYYLTGKIDILLGAELFYEILKPGQIALGDGSPILQNTSFGWIIGGSIPQTITSMSIIRNSLSVFKCSINQNKSLNDNLTKFWELEECRSKESRILSNAEQECEDIFVKTVTRDESGRFIVRLPFRDNVDKLGDSREIALKRFDSLERRLKINKTLYDKYSEFMREYITLDDTCHQFLIVIKNLSQLFTYLITVFSRNRAMQPRFASYSTHQQRLIPVSH